MTTGISLVSLSTFTYKFGNFLKKIKAKISKNIITY